ncbi:MAG: GntR family transcriptional regulator [Pseudomonadota bacterium]
MKSSSVSAAGQSTSVQIHDVLVGRIQRGEISPDERLVDTAVAAEFGVSRMPARDALMRLAHEGYLEPTTRGFILPRLDHVEILEIFDLRRLLEPRAAAMAAQGLSEEELVALENTLKDARCAMAEGDQERLFRACEIFRNGWISAVSNSSLRKALQRYMTQVQAVRMMTFADPANHPLIVEGNSRLFEAFRQRDAVAASDRILRFVFDGEAAYLAAHQGAQNEQTTSVAQSD